MGTANISSTPDRPAGRQTAPTIGGEWGFSDQQETLPLVQYFAAPNRHLANNYNERDQSVQASFDTEERTARATFAETR
jgi:hypothetical protein